KTHLPTGGLAAAGNPFAGAFSVDSEKVAVISEFRCRATCQGSCGNQRETPTKIRSDAAKSPIPQPAARRAELARRLPCAGDGHSSRSASPHSLGRALLPGIEDCRADHAGDARIPGVDLWLVSAHRYRKQR